MVREGQLVTAEVVTSFNPATGEKLSEFPVAGEAGVLQAVQRARSAQKGWAALSVHERSRFVLKAKDRLLERRDEIASLLNEETGKAKLEALVNEIAVSLDALKYYAGNADKFLAPKSVSLHSLLLALSKKAQIRYEPYGVVGIITPWNYPLSLSIGPVACALLAGNTVVLKPSEFSPQVANALASFFKEAGLPSGVLEVVHGASVEGAAILNAEIDKIHFVGSVATGKKIAQGASAKLLPFTLELGGSDPMIVLEDANLERAANAAVWGRFTNAGQSCNAVKRVFVQESVYPKFKELLQNKIAQMECGPLINEKQLQLLENQVRDSVQAGAKVLTGGAKADGKGYFFQPTLLEAKGDNIRALKEEVFGPVLPLTPFKTDEEAIALANASDFGLSASIFGKNSFRVQNIVSRLQAGGVNINDVMTQFATMELPFGGVKQSGMGFSHGGAEGLRSFTQKKSVLTDRWGAKSELYWYPYSEKKYKFLSMLFGWIYK